MLYIRQIIVVAIGLFSMRIILSALGVEDYGIYNVVGGAVTMLSFLNSSMSGATMRFISFAIGENADVRKVFSNSLVLHIGIAILLVLAAETIGLWFLENKLVIPENKKFAAHVIYQLSIASTVLAILQVPYNASIMAMERMSTYAYIEIANALLKFGAIIILAHVSSESKLQLYGIMLFAVACLIFLTYLIYCKINFSFCKLTRGTKWHELRPMLNFSGWDLYGNMSVMARVQGVNMLLNMFFGPAVNAANGIAMQVQSSVMSLAYNVSAASKPQIIKSYATKEYATTISLVYTASRFGYILLLLASVPIIINMPFVLSLWLKNIPNYTIDFCRLTLLFNLFASLSFVIITAIHATGNIKRPSIINGTLYMLVIPISYILFKNGSSPTVAFVFNIAAVFLGLTSNIYTLQKYLPSFRLFEYFTKFLLPCMAIAGISAGLSYYCGESIKNEWLRLLATSFVSTFIISALSFFFILSKANRNSLISIVKSKIYG